MKGNNIRDEGAKFIAESLFFNSSLKSLDLTYNDIEHIPSIFLKIEKLEIWKQRDGVSLKHPPQEIVDKGIEEIKKYYKEFETTSKIIKKKLILIGEERVNFFSRLYV